jgi:DNA-binding IclR family transcriptional regulator
VPLHCSASGKLLLALLPTPRRSRLVRQLKLDAQTANTITTQSALETALKRIRRELISTDAEEFITGLVCVAVPVLATDGHAIATVAMQAPVARMPLERALAHAPRLRAAALALSGSFA